MYRAELPGPAGAQRSAGLDVRRVQDALKRLPEQERLVLQAEYVIARGQRVKPIKQQLGLSWAQWRQAHTRALQAFAASWAGA